MEDISEILDGRQEALFFLEVFLHKKVRKSGVLGRGTPHFFADGLPDELGDGREPLLLVLGEVLRDPFNQGDRQRHLPVPAFLQDHDDPLPFYHGWGNFLYRLTPNYCPKNFMRKVDESKDLFLTL